VGQARLEGGKEEVRCKVNRVQEEVRGKDNRFQGEGVRGKVSRLYISEAQGHQVCGARSEGGKDEVNGKVNRVQEEVTGKVSRLYVS
jgi:hypothetical protein